MKVLRLLFFVFAACGFTRFNAFTARAPVTAFLESFEEAGTTCPSGWTVISGTCLRQESSANHGTKSVFLRAVMDYGSSGGIYKAYDLTGKSTVQLDVTRSDHGANGGTTTHCLQIYSAAPSGAWDTACATGLVNVITSDVGKMTLNLGAYNSGTYYIAFRVIGSYWPDAANFDSLVIQ